LFSAAKEYLNIHPKRGIEKGVGTSNIYRHGTVALFGAKSCSPGVVAEKNG